MPDLKSELSKVIQSWEETPQPATTMTNKPYHTTSNNITRATFEYVAKNPGVTRHDLIAALSNQGYKNSSSSSMVTQMLQNGNFRYEGDGLFPTQTEYAPRPRPAPLKSRARKPPRVVAAPVVEVEPTPTKPEWTVESVIGGLNVRQAMAVYMELKQIFGG